MIRSMTAFSQQNTKTVWGEATWEIRAINRRFLEPNLRLPEGFRELETECRTRIKKHLQRGKIDCTLTFTQMDLQAGSINVNKGLIRELMAVCDELCETHIQLQPPKVSELLRWPGAIAMGSIQLEEVHEQILDLLDKTLESLNQSRVREGEALKAFLIEHLEQIEKRLQPVIESSEQVFEQQKAKLEAKLNDLKLKVDQERIEQEIVLLAQKMDVSEELERLQTHLKETRRILDEDDVAGKRLDFMMQEISRETNTLGVKSSHTDLAIVIVDIKVLVEKMREQIQNIE